MKKHIIFLLSITCAVLLLGCDGKVATVEPTPEPIIESTPEPTVEPTIETTPEPVAEVIPEATPEPTPEATPEPAPEATPSPSSPYTFTDLNEVKYTKSKVNVRSLPTTDGEKVGSLELNAEVKVTGQCNETSWYRIEFDGKEAFVSNDYLSNEKSSTQAQESTNSNTNTSTKPSGGFNIVYKTVSEGTWYTDEAGLKCRFYNNSLGKMINKEYYTKEGILATYSQAVTDLGNGKYQAYACGCCGYTFATNGVNGYGDVCKLIYNEEVPFHVGYNVIQDVCSWVGAEDYTHNLCVYEFTLRQ